MSKSKTDDNWIRQVSWNEDGLVPAIAQNDNSGQILTLAWMNEEALQQTVRTGYATYWSRSRQQLWKKGESSGHTQRIKAIYMDCDADALLLEVEPEGGIACHTGKPSCFFRQLQDERWCPSEDYPQRPGGILRQLFNTLVERKDQAQPDSSYTASLLAADPERLLKKIGEEAIETLLAAQQGEKEQIVHETADLWYHTLVMLVKYNIDVQSVLDELADRMKQSGLKEKAGRVRPKE